jgi:hypothetical protein
MPKFTEMLQACAWCSKELEKVKAEEYEAERMATTHGICPECYQAEIEKINADENEYGEF